MTVRRTEHCLCGSSLTIYATSKAGLDLAFDLWRAIHVGDEHGPATKQQANTARIRSEQRAQEVHGETTMETLP